MVEMPHRLGVHLVAHLALRHGFGEKQRGFLARIEKLRIFPGRQRLDLRVADAGLARHLQVLRPFVLGTHQLRAAQDDELAQRARRARVVAESLRELAPGGDEARMVGEAAVKVGRRAPQLFEAPLHCGLEVRERCSWHGRDNNRMDFELTRPPADFIDDPYRHYAALRERDPVHRFADGGVFLSKYEDAVAVYRSPAASSDKKVEFKPKFGDSPLYEHHTTSLVFNDPPLHTRVRRLIMGAVNQRAIARMEAQVTRLVDALLDDMAQKGKVDFIADFAAQIPIEVIGNLLDIPKPERSPLRDWSIAILSGLEPKLTPEMHERG